jgi:HPt (histidine-containing phosphotransfer) domain-containing protein
MTTTPLPAGVDGAVTLDLRAVESFQEASPDGSRDFVLALIAQFLEEAATHVDAIVDAARAGDAGRLARTAHSLKGSSLVMGAHRLAALCADLERRLTDHPEDALTPETGDAFGQELARVRAAFAANQDS